MQQNIPYKYQALNRCYNTTAVKPHVEHNATGLVRKFHLPAFIFAWICINIIVSLLYFEFPTIDLALIASIFNTLAVFFLTYTMRLSVLHITAIILVIDAISNYHIGLMTAEYYITLSILHKFFPQRTSCTAYHTIYSYTTFVLVLCLMDYALFGMMRIHFIF